MCDEAGGCCFCYYCLAKAGNFRGVCPSKSGEYEYAQPGQSTLVSLALPDSVYVKPHDGTPGSVFVASTSILLYIQRGGTPMAVNEKIRVRLKSYEHTLADQAAEKIVEIAKRNGAEVSGPVPLPTEKEIVTILRAVHKYKDTH